MLKSVLFASAAAIVAASSLIYSNMIVISENAGKQSLRLVVTDLRSQVADLRQVLAEHDVLLTENASYNKFDQLDTASQEHVTASTGNYSASTREDFDIGLDIPSPDREQLAIDFRTLWFRAEVLEGELQQMQALFAESAMNHAGGEGVAEVSLDSHVLSDNNMSNETLSSFEETQRKNFLLKEELTPKDKAISSLVHRLSEFNPGAAPRQVTSALENVPPGEFPASTAGSLVSEIQYKYNGPSDMSRIEADNEKTSLEGVTVAEGVRAYNSGNFARASSIWQSLGASGDIRAMFYLGALYYEGRGIERNLETARSLLEKAHNAGHSRASHLLDRVRSEFDKLQAYSPEHEITPRDNSLVSVSRVEEEAGDTAPKSLTVADGISAYKSKNYALASVIWRELADSGDIWAKFYLGALYFEGHGVERNLETAHGLLAEADRAGHSGAAKLLERITAATDHAQVASFSAYDEH